MKTKRFFMIIIVLLFLLPILAVGAGCAESQLVAVSGNLWYDEDQNMYVYLLDDSGAMALYTSVVDGMITNDTVSIRADFDGVLHLYRDGELLSDVALQQIKTPGSYVLMLNTGESVDSRILSFTIVEKLTNSVHSYMMPTGFELTGVTLNDVPVDFTSNMIELTGEGDYSVHYRCVRTGVTHSLLLTTDFTGPVLALEGVSGGTASGAVDISDAKGAKSITIHHNGDLIDYTPRLTSSGEYVIRLSDEAGNVSIYTFVILIYFDSNSWIFFGLLALVLVGVGGYILYSRKKLRVR